ncbi:MAG: beta-ketoacyl-ACP synthase II [Dorea sp.]|jgi:3-oxoacyl-[acyl-carrier-protein] synthase II|nr:beta-ketoacyl-ACP synthase II [Dorea sp.]
MSKRRVVVTGMGAVTPIGNNTAEFWDSIRAGRVGIGPITAFDTEGYKVKLAAEVKDFDAKKYMDFKTAKRMERFSQFAVAAAAEAFRDSGINMEQEDPFRAGVIIGSGVGSLQEVESATDRIREKGPSRVNLLLVPRMISNMAAGNVSIHLGFRGKCTNVATACATGSHCIGDAFRAIQYGDADIMAAGGAESCICPTGVAGFTALTALSQNPDPTRASIPFDKDRDGFVIGEGAGVVILEELEHAKARGAHIYAEVAGYGATGDAYHITSPIEDGSGAAKAMELAMEEAGAAAVDIDYVNAHGTATHHNDLFETKAIKSALGKAAEDVVVNSTKSMVGHLLGAAGGVEFIVCVKSIQEGFIHQTMGTRETDAECDLNYAVGAPVEKPIHYAMSNSLGFGGHNASLLIKEYKN